jgi:gliding motility-associated-like protein
MVSAPDNITTWAWDFENNGSVDDGTQSPTYTYTSAGTVTAVLTGTTNSGCTGSVSATVKVNALPTATFTPVNACLNNNVVLNNTSSVPAPDNISNYSWNFGVGANPATATGTVANPTPLVYTTAGIKTIVLNITANTTCTATITQTVEVYPQPVASFSTTSVCQGTATAFTDLSTTSVGTISGWQWDYTHDGINDNATQNPSNTYSPSGTYTAQLIATTSNGCKDTVQVPVNVWGHAVPDFTATTVCFNTATSFSNLTTTLNPNTGGAPAYGWDFGDGTGTSAATNPGYTYASSASGATFTAVLTATTTNGCVDMVSHPVKINALPTATFTPVNACLNNNVLLNNTSGIGLPDNLTGWSWSFGAGASPLTSTVTNPPSLTYSTSGPKSITLIVTANTSCTASITQTVDIYPQPVANFSTTSVCQGTATAYTDLSTTSVGTVNTWQWDFTNNGSIDNATQNPSTTFTASGTPTTNLIVTTSNGCKDTIALAVNVWGHAVPDFTATTVCFNEATTFGNLTSTTVNPNTGGAPVYSWNFGDGSPTDATTSPGHTYTSSISGATFNATLIATTTNGCADSVTKVVKINALPTATFTPVNACMNNNVLLNNTSSIGLPDNISTYSWNFGATATPATSAAQNPPSLTYSSSGPKTITLLITANTSCTATITQTVDIYPQPVANFSTTSVCQSTATAFTDLSTTSVGTITGWEWDFTNNATPDSMTQNPTHIFPSSGTFTTSLIATSSNGCKDTVKLAVEVWGHTIPDFSPDNVCFGTATTFTNLTSETINQNTGSPSAYSWNFADAGTSNQINPVHTYTLGGNTNATYNVTLTATSFHGCADSVVKVVKVFAVPTASFTADSVCFGSPSHLFDASNGNGNVIGTYDWDFTGDGNPEATATANPNYTFPNFGINPVSYTVSTNPIAGLTCKNVTTSLTVWVNPNPVPAFTFVNSCINAQPNTFDAGGSTIAIGTNTAYAWQFGDAANATYTTATTSHTYALAQAYNVTLTVTSNKGCMTSMSQQVTVYPKPAVSFSFSPTCENKVMTLTGMTLPGSGTINNWNWDMNNSITSFEKNTQVITYTFPAPSSTGTQSVTLVTITDHGCHDTIQRTVYIDYAPKPDFKVDDPDGCPEHCVTFTDLTPAVTGPAQNVDWKWVFGDGQQLHAATNGQQPHCYDNTTSNQVNTFDVKLVVTTDKGCTDSISKASFITVYPTPVAAYDVAPNPGDVITPLIYFTNHSLDYTKWWWSFGDGPQLDSTNVDPTHFYGSETADTYQSILIVENQYGCRDEARVKVEILPEFTFYIPNAFTPANNDGINDVFTGKGIGIEHYEMWIFDRWGAMIFYTDDITKGWNGKVQGKSQEVQQDVYIWKVKVKDVLGKKHDYVGHVTLLR